VMPDHVHCLVRPADGLELADWVASVKKYSSAQINKGRGRTGRASKGGPAPYRASDPA